MLAGASAEAHLAVTGTEVGQESAFGNYHLKKIEINRSGYLGPIRRQNFGVDFFDFSFLGGLLRLVHHFRMPLSRASFQPRVGLHHENPIEPTAAGGEHCAKSQAICLWVVPADQGCQRPRNSQKDHQQKALSKHPTFRTAADCPENEEKALPELVVEWKTLTEEDNRPVLATSNQQDVAGLRWFDVLMVTAISSGNIFRKLKKCFFSPNGPRSAGSRPRFQKVREGSTVLVVPVKVCRSFQVLFRQVPG